MLIMKPMKCRALIAFLLILTLFMPALSARGEEAQATDAAQAGDAVQDADAARAGDAVQDADAAQTGDAVQDADAAQTADAGQAADPASAQETADDAANTDPALFIPDTGQLLPFARWPRGPKVSAEGACLLECSSGIELYARNSHEKLYPASTTKLLTCLLAMDYVTDLKDMVYFSEAAVLSVPKDGSEIGIDPGEQLTVEECFYGILVGSANECSNAIAEYCCGSISAFVEKMNEKAAALGCTDSHFANTNGYHEDAHYTSAHDLALIGAAFFENEYLRGIGNTPSYHFTPTPTQKDDFWLRNKHQLINGDLPFDGIIGGKTGYTSLAGQTLVTGAEQNGMRLVAVVMREESPKQFTDSALLLKYGFESFSLIPPTGQSGDLGPARPEFLRSGPDLAGHAFGTFETEPGALILLRKPLDASELQVTLQADETEDAFATLSYSFENLTLGRATLTYSPAVTNPLQNDALFINVRHLVLILTGLVILAILIGALGEFTQSYAFTRRRDIWKSRLDSRRRHRKPF